MNISLLHKVTQKQVIILPQRSNFRIINISANGSAYCRPAVWLLDKLLFFFLKVNRLTDKDVGYLLGLMKTVTN